MQHKHLVSIYADGACRGNPGIGGYGAILKYNHHVKELSGVSLHTTNNKMELTAVIEALKVLKSSCSIDIYTDSQYVQKGITLWIDNWKKKNWKNIKNTELWIELDSLCSNHEIRWHWVRGHSGNPGNERADELANIAIDNHHGKLN